MRAIQKGTADQSVVIRIVDSGDGTPETGVEHNTSGIDLWYRREGATKTSITEAALSALDDAHSDGGIEHIGDGYYRLDLPDAAFATGSNGVAVGGTVTGMVVIGCYVHLVDYNPQDAVRLGLTALPNAAADAAGGLPISDAGGLDLDAQIGTKINDILTDTGTTLQGELDGIQADTEDIQSKLGSPAGASVSADIAAVKVDTAAILVDTAEIGAAGAGLTEAGGTGDHLTAVPWNAAWDAEVQSEATDALVAYDPPTKAELDAAVAPLALEATLEAVDDLVDTEVAEIKTVVDAIEVDTQNIQSRLPAALVKGRMDSHNPKGRIV